jgi:hypothetical protein
MIDVIKTEVLGQKVFLIINKLQSKGHKNDPAADGCFVSRKL